VGKLTRRLLVAVLLGVVVYGALVLYRDVHKVADSLRHFAWGSFALACGLAFTNYLLRFLKWEYYLAKLGIRDVPKLESMLTFFSGFVLTITPGKVGEVFKSVILAQTRGVPIARSAPIVVAERVTDLIGIIVMITVGSLSFEGGVFWASAGAAIVAALLAFVSVPSLSDPVIAKLPSLPGALGRFGGRAAPKLAESLGGLRELTPALRLVWPTVLSIAAWSLEGIGLWVILRGFGERPGLPQTAFIYATATLAGALIPVPGGLGVTEKLLEEQMARLAHVPFATATAAMILVRFATLWFAVAVGFLALAILRLRHPGLRTSVEADARKDAKFAG